MGRFTLPIEHAWRRKALIHDLQVFEAIIIKSKGWKCRNEPLELMFILGVHIKIELSLIILPRLAAPDL